MNSIQSRIQELNGVLLRIFTIINILLELIDEKLLINDRTVLLKIETRDNIKTRIQMYALTATFNK